MHNVCNSRILAHKLNKTAWYSNPGSVPALPERPGYAYAEMYREQSV